MKMFTLHPCWRPGACCMYHKLCRHDAALSMLRICCTWPDSARSSSSSHDVCHDVISSFYFLDRWTWFTPPLEFHFSYSDQKIIHVLVPRCQDNSCPENQKFAAYYLFALITATVSRQIASSSFVGITQTATLESSVEIFTFSPRTLFRSSQSSIPR